MRWDPFLGFLVGVAVVGTLFPATGVALEAAQLVQVVAIGLLFFLYGVRLSAAETLHNLRHWRLQVAILATTFAVYPLVGVAVRQLPEAVLAEPLSLGVLMLCIVPSTMQGCVAFTRIGGGNTAAAVVSASLSNLLGVFLVPAYVMLLIGAQAQVTGESVLRIVGQLLAPFIAGQLLRPLFGAAVERNEGWLRHVDRGAILVVVFVAFSEGSQAGIWSAVPARSFAVVALVCVLLLAAAFAWTATFGRWCGFSREDRIALLFCGSTKSLASGLPMISVLFPGPSAALIVMPLMLYHQVQLIVSSIVADRLGRSDPSSAVP
ncbi:MAG: bile acid:sodium symporter family protein [Aeromicrobium sp.]|uniref:bile acid:sodium symporter family protein n=1 Tax=Aeromicrobium sp. TaxID=1871063 RepID=UPI0039E332E2